MATDFLEYFGQDSEVRAIVMYIEAIRDGRRFVEVAGAATKIKLVVSYKGGKTSGGVKPHGRSGRKKGDLSRSLPPDRNHCLADNGASSSGCPCPD
jgi:succinyl-CoA synthetase alpha subunit